MSGNGIKKLEAMSNEASRFMDKLNDDGRSFLTECFLSCRSGFYSLMDNMESFVGKIGHAFHNYHHLRSTHCRPRSRIYEHKDESRISR